MKTLFLILFLFCATTVSLYSQKYHTPDQMLKIMIDSKVNYTLNTTSASTIAIEADTYRTNLTHPGLYIEPAGSNGREAIRSYMDHLRKDTVVFSILHRAENFFAEGAMEQARELYEEVLEYYPKNSQIMTYIGQTYQKENNAEEAREWLEKAVATNRIDYMAHWFLANTYMEQGNMEQAVRHIVIAHVLNRNNPRLQFSLEYILRANGTPYDNWEFTPVYSLDTAEAGKVLITVAREPLDEWLFYALCKAAWAAEPGYAESVLANSDQPRAMIEEKEALTVFAVGMANKYKDFPTPNEDANRLITVIKEGHIDAFALYEVVFRRNPNMATMLPEAMFDTFQEYILRYHTKKE